VAMFPTALKADPLPRSVAKLARHRSRRCRTHVHHEIDRLPTCLWNDRDFGCRQKTGRDQRAAKIVHLVLTERIARFEAGDLLDMPSVERRLPSDPDRTEMSDGARLDR